MTTRLPDNLTDDERLVLYLAGELPEPDSAAVRAWLDRDADARQWADSFGRIDTALRLDADAAHAHETPALSAARHVVAAWQNAHPATEAKRRRLWLPPKWTVYPVAAALVLAGLMGGWWYSVRDEYARPGAKYIDNSPPMLGLWGRPELPVDQVGDDALSRQFNSMIVDRVWDRENPDNRISEQVASLEYLKRATR